MYEFVAVVLICLKSVPVEACTEHSAADVMSTYVDSEIGCVMGWQEIVARAPRAREIGRGAYMRTVCRRVQRPGDEPKTR